MQHGENQALWATCHLNPTVWCRIMATVCHAKEKIRSSSLWVPEETCWGLHGRTRSEMKTSEKNWLTETGRIKKEGSYGWDMSWKWTTLEQLVRQHTGNWEVTRESQDDQRRTGWMSSNQTSDRRTQPGKKPKNWQMTNQNSRRVAECSHLDVGWTKV